MFKPDSDPRYSGRTYYFTIVTKEKNSDSVKYSLYCTVKVEGEVNAEYDEEYEAYDVGFDDDKSSNSTKVQEELEKVHGTVNSIIAFLDEIFM